MMLSGNLTDWSVGDLMQMLHITKKTASLHVSAEHRYGVVHFEDGTIVNADVSLGGGAAREPKDEVIEAIYVLALLDEGTFEIKGEVPSRMIDPISVADALELAGEHLAAESRLYETGLLAARALRLAPSIDEPIILSEQVWNAISGSIPAFTFSELEERMGRAAAIATVEQFRDLGILEAALDGPEPAEEVMQSPIEHVEIVESAEPVSSGPMSDLEPSQVTVGEDVKLDEFADLGWGTRHVDDQADGQSDLEVDDAPDDGRIVPVDVDEIRPIVSEAPDDAIVLVGVGDLEPISEATPASGVTSLSEAIRAAAGAGVAEDRSTDGEPTLSAEAAEAGDEPSEDAAQAGDDSLRRTVRSLVSEPKSPLTNGMLGDLGARIRQAASVERDD